MRPGNDRATAEDVDQLAAIARNADLTRAIEMKKLKAINISEAIFKAGACGVI